MFSEVVLENIHPTMEMDAMDISVICAGFLSAFFRQLRPTTKTGSVILTFLLLRRIIR